MRDRNAAVLAVVALSVVAIAGSVLFWPEAKPEIVSAAAPPPNGDYDDHTAYFQSPTWAEITGAEQIDPEALWAESLEICDQFADGATTDDLFEGGHITSIEELISADSEAMDAWADRLFRLMGAGLFTCPDLGDKLLTFEQ